MARLIEQQSTRAGNTVRRTEKNILTLYNGTRSGNTVRTAEKSTVAWLKALELATLLEQQKKALLLYKRLDVATLEQQKKGLTFKNY